MASFKGTVSAYPMSRFRKSQWKYGFSDNEESQGTTGGQRVLLASVISRYLLEPSRAGYTLA